MSKATVLLPLLSLSMTVELGSAHKQWSAFRGMFKRIKYATPSRGDPGQPLFLTPYIESGRTEEGRQLSLVGPLPGANVMSYSGYLTVNKIHNSNLFFWFFPAQCLNESFLGHPSFPCFILTIHEREKGPHVTNIYAGKYVPAIGYYIHTHNPTAKVKINFKGVAIGDGFCDPEMMLGGYAQFLYQIGLVDEKQRDYVQQQADLGVIYIQQKKWTEAFEIFNFLINGDETGIPSYSQNVTGCSNFFNMLQCQWPDDQEYFGEFLLLPEERKSIHVANLTFHDGSTVEKHLLEDVMNTIKPWLAILMDNYKVLLYSGQLDIIVAAPLTEHFLPTVLWSKVEDYKNAERLVWKIHPQDKEVAGYVRQAGDFYQVIV